MIPLFLIASLILLGMSSAEAQSLYDIEDIISPLLIFSGETRVWVAQGRQQ